MLACYQMSVTSHVVSRSSGETDRGALGERLGNQHPIERVAVMPRQRCDGVRHARLLSVVGELRRWAASVPCQRGLQLAQNA